MSKVISKDQYLIPFFANTKTVVVGLNQLGMRNASEQMFITLLPGLNNVSQRIRYYSFYCWWFEHYYEGKKEVESKILWKDLRKAEFLLALINVAAKKDDGVPGTTYATKHHLMDLDEVNLDEANISSDAYWANPRGIFGQYYAASLFDMAIIGPNEEKGYYNIIKDTGMVDGKSLSDAFQTSVEESGQLFLSCLNRGSVRKDEITKMLEAFDMKSIPTGTWENQLLKDLIIQKDYPTREGETAHRRQTIKYLLDYYDSRQKLSDRAFTEYMYRQYLAKQLQDTTAFGWYTYYLNNEWQYRSSALLKEVLKYIKDTSEYMWTKVDDVSRAIASKVCVDLFGKEIPELPLNEAIKACSELKDVGQFASGSIYSLLQLCFENPFDAEAASKANEEFGLTDHGDIPENNNRYTFAKMVQDWKEKPVRNFIEKYVADNVIYAHYFVATRKQYESGIDSHKFALENGCIRYLAPFEETHTTPRIESLIDFLRDLELIGDNTESNRSALLNKLNADD